MQSEMSQTARTACPRCLFTSSADITNFLHGPQNEQKRVVQHLRDKGILHLAVLRKLGPPPCHEADAPAKAMFRPVQIPLNFPRTCLIGYDHQINITVRGILAFRHGPEHEREIDPLLDRIKRAPAGTECIEI